MQEDDFLLLLLFWAVFHYVCVCVHDYRLLQFVLVYNFFIFIFYFISYRKKSHTHTQMHT